MARADWIIDPVGPLHFGVGHKFSASKSNLTARLASCDTVVAFLSAKTFSWRASGSRILTI
jgi:hypothetical protein